MVVQYASSFSDASLGLGSRMCAGMASSGGLVGTGVRRGTVGIGIQPWLRYIDTTRVVPREVKRSCWVNGRSLP